MKISARNTLEGKILSIKEGPVSTEVVAYAIIKASNVMIGVDD